MGRAQCWEFRKKAYFFLWRGIFELRSIPIGLSAPNRFVGFQLPIESSSGIEKVAVVADLVLFHETEQ